MSQIKIKHRLFEIIEERSENSFIAAYKGKAYFINKFVPKTEAGNELVFSCSRIASAGIRSPKVKIIDKRNGYIVREYIEGISVMEMLSRDELPEDVYHQLFLNAYLAKINTMTLNYEPDKWILSKGTLYYVYPHFILFNEEKDLVKHYLRLWFATNESLVFLSKHGLTLGKDRLKDEYTTNKNIVQMVIKHYR